MRTRGLRIDEWDWEHKRVAPPADPYRPSVQAQRHRQELLRATINKKAEEAHIKRPVGKPKDYSEWLSASLVDGWLKGVKNG